MPYKHTLPSDEETEKVTSKRHRTADGFCVTSDSGSASSASSYVSSSSSASHPLQDDDVSSPIASQNQLWARFLHGFFVTSSFSMLRMSDLDTWYRFYRKETLPQFIKTLSEQTQVNVSWLLPILSYPPEQQGLLEATDKQLSVLARALANGKLNMKIRLPLCYLLSCYLSDASKIDLCHRLSQSSFEATLTKHSYAIWKLVLRLPLSDDDISEIINTIASVKLCKDSYSAFHLWVSVIFSTQQAQLISIFINPPSLLEEARQNPYFLKTVIYNAIVHNHMPIIKYYVEQKHINIEEDIKALCMLAASAGHLNIIQYLLAFDTSSNLGQKDLSEICCTAALNGHLDIVKYFTAEAQASKKTCVYNAEGRLVATALHNAAKAGQLDIVKYLMECDKSLLSMKIEIGFEREAFPLHLAAALGHLDVVEALVNAKVPLYEKNAQGYIPLQLATKQGHLTIVEYFIASHGFYYEKTDQNETLLHLALSHGHVSVFNYLIGIIAALSHKSRILDARTKAGDTALHLAAQYGHLSVVENLINHGASVKVRNSLMLTVFHVAAKFGRLNIVKYLLQRSPDLRDLQAKNERTALNLAAEHQQLVIVRFLIMQGMDPYVAAARYGKCYDAVKCLVSSGIVIIDIPEVPKILITAVRQDIAEKRLQAERMAAKTLSQFSSPQPQQISAKSSSDLEMAPLAPFISVDSDYLKQALEGEASAIDFLAKLPGSSQTILIHSLHLLTSKMDDAHPEKARLLTLYETLTRMRATTVDAQRVNTESTPVSIYSSPSSPAMFASGEASTSTASAALSTASSSSSFHHC